MKINVRFGKIVLPALVMLGAACGGQSSTATVGALSADPTARSFGVASYAVEGDNVRMLDQYGMELGTLFVHDDGAERRLVDVALVNGTTDQIEIYRPRADGRFVAPIARDFVAGAALSDAALAPLLDRHNVAIYISSMRVEKTTTLGESIVATTTSCTTPSSDTPLGCARPANTAVGCSNPSQLPAAITQDYKNNLGPAPGYPTNDVTTLSQCLNIGSQICSSTYGTCSDPWCGQTQLNWYNYGVVCDTVGGNPTYYNASCEPRHTVNQWIASCPRSTCGTVGQYDSVPRIRDCYDPGSCTKYQGTVGCTPYH